YGGGRMSLARLSIALLLPGCGAYQLIKTATRHLPPTPATHIFRFALAPVFGVGISSALYFLWLFSFGNPAAGYLIAEGLFWLAVVVFCRRFGAIRETSCDRWPVPWPARSGLTNLIAVLSVIVLASATAGLIGQTSVHPLGCWDAWAIWNLRA